MATTKIQLPAPVSGITNNKAKPTRTRAESFKAWKDALEQAQSAVGYDKDNSPIKGKSRVDVLKIAISHLNSVAPNNSVDEAKELLTELLKRENARQVAGKTYRS